MQSSSSSDRSQPDASQQPLERATLSQIRKAATQSNLEVLKEALQGWTSAEIDDAQSSTKNAVHMAAWQGPLSNLQYLLEDFGCDPNVISTGDYSYGKTPLFFACTRSRNTVVEYLLNNHRAKVTICNNKGQSIRSIAASHLDERIVEMIRQLEFQQNEWIKYRETHSDGLEYGDLDPRFLGRSLCDSDVVTKDAINPTTKASRKGSFFRRNPQLNHGYDDTNEKRGDKKKKGQVPVLTNEEELEKEQAWKRIQDYLATANDHVSTAARDLLTIVKLNDKLRQPWIPQLSSDLMKQTDVTHVQHLVEVSIQSTTEPREHNLLVKLLAQIKDPHGYRQLSYQASTIKPPDIHEQQHPLWARVCKLLLAQSKGPSLQALVQEDNAATLSLPNDALPIFVDTIASLHSIKAELVDATLVAFDTEWYDANNVGTNQLATFQLAVVDNSNSFSSWIIDLMDRDDISHQLEVADFIRWLFSEKQVMGFAVRHNDIPKLRAYCGSDKKELSFDDCLDLQLVLGSMISQQHQLPGLQAAVGRYSDTNVLSKEQQCSDWALRPLTTAQLNYAALDAVILLVLAVEMKKEHDVGNAGCSGEIQS